MPDDAVNDMIEAAVEAAQVAYAGNASGYSIAESILASLGLPLETLAALKAGTMVAVPVEPTPEMMAAVGATSLQRRIWGLMIAARPQPNGGGDVGA